MGKGSPTFTLEWKVPISLVISIVGLAVYMTMGYNRVMAKLDDTVSPKQVRAWIEDVREMNPALHFPRFPERQPDRKDTSRPFEAVALSSRSEDKPTKH